MFTYLLGVLCCVFSVKSLESLRWKVIHKYRFNNFIKVMLQKKWLCSVLHIYPKHFEVTAAMSANLFASLYP